MFKQLNNTDLQATNGGENIDITGMALNAGKSYMAPVSFLGNRQDRQRQERVFNELRNTHAQKNQIQEAAAADVTYRSDSITRRNDEWLAWMNENPEKAQKLMRMISGV